MSFVAVAFNIASQNLNFYKLAAFFRSNFKKFLSTANKMFLDFSTNRQANACMTILHATKLKGN